MPTRPLFEALNAKPRCRAVVRTFLAAGCLSLFASSAFAQGTLPPLPGAAPPPVVVVTGEPPPAMIIVQPAEAPPVVVTVPAETHAPKPPKTHEEWYGYQTLIADGASVGMMIAAGSVASHGSERVAGKLLLAGSLTYVFGGPIIHWMHGNIGQGFGSLGLRVGVPLAGLFWGVVIGSALETHRGESEMWAVGGAIGFLGGMAGAMLVDSALLAYEKVPDQKPEGEEAKLAPAKHPIRLVPQLSVGPHGAATVGLSGVFF